MSTMTSTLRGTTAVNIAPTTQNQNTAPVFEFECLFTHDLRKKKKTWHDGSLRFHTFNRRVMVYDDSKNFIGDLHYRDADELQEGEELRLDKGVLVDVGRRTGQTETDLAEVLDKGRHGDEGAQARQATLAATYQSMQRVPSANTQARPKSLAAVLGASQGPIGRARLAIKSPYELLHTARPESVFEQPPAKRQRLAVDKENMLSVASVVRAEQQVERRSPPSFSPSLPRAPLAARKDANIIKAVIDISSEDEEPMSPTFSSAFGSSRSRQTGTKAIRNPPAKLDLMPKPSKPKQKALPRLLSVVETPKLMPDAQAKKNSAVRPVLTVQSSEVSSKAQGKQLVPTKPVPMKNPANALSKATRKQKGSLRPAVATNEHNFSEKAQEKQEETALPEASSRSERLYSGPTSSLRFAPQNPRAKLIYKDLLPPSFISSRQGSWKTTDTASGQAGAPAHFATRLGKSLQNSRPKRHSEKDVLDVSGLKSVPSQQQQRAVTPAKSPLRLRTMSPLSQASSSLFVTQSPSNVVQNTVVIEDDSPVPSPIKTPPPNQMVENERAVDDELLEDSPISVEMPDAAPSVVLVSKLTLMDQRLMMPPPQIVQPSLQIRQPPSPLQETSCQEQQPAPQVRLQTISPAKSPQPRPLRRVLSESDSPAHGYTRQIVSPPARIPSALNGMQQRNRVLESQQPFKSPAKLQRSHSDTAAMLQIEMHRPIGRGKVNTPDIVQEEEDGDSGPWSSREAFLLFDWWPPGREKPDYGSNVKLHNELHQQSFNGFMHPRNAESFGQPRGVIRDGIDI